MIVNFIAFWVKSTINVSRTENCVSHIITMNIGWQIPQRNQSNQKLFVNRRKGNDTEERNTCYKLYRKRLIDYTIVCWTQVLPRFLIQHKANIKKSWQGIKSIINKRKKLSSQLEIQIQWWCFLGDGKRIANRFNVFSKCWWIFGNRNPAY